MAGSIEELLDFLYATIDEAKNMPLSNDKCIIERDKALDTLDDIRAQLPIELKKARDLLASRNDYISSAKREADNIRQTAEDQAKRLINENNITLEAKKQGAEIVSRAEEQGRKLARAASEYCEDIMRRMEDSLAETYEEAKHTRAQFRSMLAGQNAAPSRGPTMYDLEEDDDI